MTQISRNLVEQFLKKTVGANNKLDAAEARKLGLDANKVNKADFDESGDVTVEEILDSELYEQFATMCEEEQEREQEAEDEEQKRQRLDKDRTSGKNEEKA